MHRLTVVHSGGQGVLCPATVAGRLHACRGSHSQFMSYRQVLQQLALNTHGVITTGEARAVGIPAVEVRKIAARGFLQRIGHGAYRVLLVPATPETPYAEALAIAGAGSFLGPAATLAVARLMPMRHVLDVYVPRVPRRAVVPGVLVEQAPAYNCDTTTIRGLRTLALVNALAQHHPRWGEDRLSLILDEARHRRLISEEEWAEVRSIRHGCGWRDC